METDQAKLCHVIWAKPLLFYISKHDRKNRQGKQKQIEGLSKLAIQVDQSADRPLYSLKCKFIILKDKKENETKSRFGPYVYVCVYGHLEKCSEFYKCKTSSHEQFTSSLYAGNCT